MNWFDEYKKMCFDAYNAQNIIEEDKVEDKVEIILNKIEQNKLKKEYFFYSLDKEKYLFDNIHKIGIIESGDYIMDIKYDNCIISIHNLRKKIKRYNYVSKQYYDSVDFSLGEEIKQSYFMFKKFLTKEELNEFLIYLFKLKDLAAFL